MKSFIFNRWLVLLLAYLLYLWTWESAFGTEPIEKRLHEHILFNHDGPNEIGHILIDDRTNGINQGTWLYVKGALDYYRKNKPIFIILELNTPGGEVFAAQQISDALKNFDFQENIPVVAYINNWAISAGAMLALSCRYIAVDKDGIMGAAEPVTQDSSGKMETASEKINSVLRVDFANRAAYFDRNSAIAEAMVDKDLILVLRDNIIVKLDSEALIRTTGSDPDIVISSKGKLLTLGAEDLLKYRMADFIVQPIRQEQVSSKVLAIGQWPASQSALFHQPFFDSIPNATIDAFRMDWKMQFFAFLMSPTVASLLFMGMSIGFYLEFTSSGFGIAGTIAVTCLFLILLSSFALEIGSFLELILLFVGLGIILIEVFVLPTFGLLGFIGAIFFLSGLFGIMLPGIGSFRFDVDSYTLNAAGDSVLERLAFLSGSILLSFIFIVILSRYLPSRFSRMTRLVLKGNEQVGFIAGEANKDLPQPGKIGVAAVTLRPAGKIIVDEILYDAVSIGVLIEKDAPVVVVGLEGSTIMVTPMETKL